MRHDEKLLHLMVQSGKVRLRFVEVASFVECCDPAGNSARLVRGRF